MKKILFSALMLVGGIMCSCSSYDEPANLVEDVTATGNTVFKFSSSAVSVVASRSVEDSNVSEQGTESEWKVNNVRIYLFDSKTKTLAKTYLLKDLKRTIDTGNGMVTYTSEHILLAHGTYDVFAIANSQGMINATSEAEFIDNIDAETYKVGVIEDTTDGIVMTNRANANLTTEIKSFDNKSANNVVDITLERVVARVDVARNADRYEMKDEKGNLYAYLSLEDFHLVNVPKSFYTFRHVADLTTMEKPVWSLDVNYGNVSDVNGYVIDPYFFNKTNDAAAFDNKDGYYENFVLSYFKGASVKWTKFNAAAQEPAYNTCYCLENCTMQAAQKNGYSTGVVFRGSVEPNDNVYGIDGNGKLAKIAADVRPDVLYYFNYRFYNSIDALAKAGVRVTEQMSAEELHFLDVQKYQKEGDKYYAYYTYWIRHLDNDKPLEMGVMEFAIVRNNLYRLLVTKVTDLGPGVPVINPDAPDEGEAYLKIELNVKKWIVREQTNIIL